MTKLNELNAMGKATVLFCVIWAIVSAIIVFSRLSILFKFVYIPTEIALLIVLAHVILKVGYKRDLIRMLFWKEIKND